jgi:chemotaxis protein methyltransferase CheR
MDDFAQWDIVIEAIDVNPRMIAKARSGRYGSWSLRSTPDAIKRRYFTESGGDQILDPAVRRMVSFEERNLMDDAPGFWKALGCDAVFCRNVLMYFTPENMNQVIGRLSLALRPNGFLFLGHAETLRGLSSDYHLCHTHETFYYQLRSSEVGSRLRAETPLRTELAPSHPEESTTSWVDAIDQASARIRTLGRPKPGARAEDRPAETARNAGRQGLGTVLELLRQERFEEALDRLNEAPAEAGGGLEGLLLRAVLLTNQGAHREAERACASLLRADELHAGAHYLMALCREHAGDSTAAFDHDQTAIYLDPSFAMPRLHLGLLNKRAGSPAAARRELSQALILLAREDTSRLLLYAGGFSREALMHLCRAELSRLEGAA